MGGGARVAHRSLAFVPYEPRGGRHGLCHAASSYVLPVAVPSLSSWEASEWLCAWQSGCILRCGPHSTASSPDAENHTPKFGTKLGHTLHQTLKCIKLWANFGTNLCPNFATQSMGQSMGHRLLAHGATTGAWSNPCTRQTVGLGCTTKKSSGTPRDLCGSRGFVRPRVKGGDHLATLTGAPHL